MQSCLSPAGPEFRRAAPAGRYLAFRIGRSELALAVEEVCEVMTEQDVAPFPGATGFVAGAVRLRGAAIPVLNLRPLLGKGGRASRRGAILVVRIPGSVGKVGLSADALSEVFPLDGRAVRDPEAHPNSALHAVLTGVIRLRGRMRGIVEVDGLLRLAGPDTLKTLVA